MQTVDLLNSKSLHEAIVDHGLGAGAAFFGRLEDDNHGPGEIARGGKISCGAEQHGGMPVVSASMHFSGYAGSIGQICFFVNRQRVHIRAKAYNLAASRFGALDQADDAAASDGGDDFVAAKALQQIGDKSRRAREIVHQFGMRMQVAPPINGVGYERLDLTANGHALDSVWPR